MSHETTRRAATRTMLRFAFFDLSCIAWLMEPARLFTDFIVCSAPDEVPIDLIVFSAPDKCPDKCPIDVSIFWAPGASAASAPRVCAP